MKLGKYLFFLLPHKAVITVQFYLGITVIIQDANEKPVSIVEHTKAMEIYYKLDQLDPEWTRYP